MTASAPSSVLPGGGDRLAGADQRQRRAHVLLDRVGQVRLAGEQRVEQVALADRADHLARHDRRLGLDHRHLRDAVLAQDLDRRRATVSFGWVCTRAGRSPALRAQHLADGRPRRRPRRKP